MSNGTNWVYLESSVLVGATLVGANHPQATLQFCRRQARQGSIILVSSLALLEFSHMAWTFGNPNQRRQLPQEVINEYNLSAWDLDAHVRARWMNEARRSLEALLREFDEVIEIPVLPEYWDSAIETMVAYDLNSFDALHVVTAQHFNIVTFATSDRHFASVDGLPVHLVRDP